MTYPDPYAGALQPPPVRLESGAPDEDADEGDTDPDLEPHHGPAPFVDEPGPPSRSRSYWRS